MKKSLSFISILFLISQFLFGQINPVQNLVWEHFYDDQNYENIFSLQWEEPETPHDELMGYNIYRNNELYRFQSEIGLACAPQFGHFDCEFLNYNMGVFTGHVAAVYKDGVESEYVFFEAEGFLLGSTELSKNEIKLFPNPAVDIIKFNMKLINISLLDLNGNQLKFIQKPVDELNISNLPTGIYLLKAETVSGHTFEKKFIKK